MRGCHARTAPAELNEWLDLENPDWQPSYPFPHDIRQPVVDALLAAQRGLCVYCGRRLILSRPGRSFHIEHFRPRGPYPHLATEFDNLFLSCGQETDTGDRAQTCGTAKHDWFDEDNFIEPAYPECTNRFRFFLSGCIGTDAQGDAKAEAMLTALRLNHPELVRDRKEILFHLDDPGREGIAPADFVDTETGMAESYAHMVYRVLGRTIP